MTIASVRGEVVTALLAMVMLSLVGCGAGSSDGAPTSSAANGESDVGDESGAGDETGAVTTSAAPSTTPLTPADPDTFADPLGGVWEFMLPESFGGGACHFNDGSGPYTPNESIRCSLNLNDQSPVWDPYYEVGGSPLGAAIEPWGAYKIAEVDYVDTAPTLPVGSSLTVADQSCAVLSPTSLRCAGTYGEFIFDDGDLSFERSDPLPEVGNAGQACGTVEIRGQQQPVFIALGTVECSEALTIMQQYVDIPIDGENGNANVREIGPYTCSMPTAVAAQQEGITVACGDSDDTNRFVVPLSTSIGD